MIRRWFESARRWPGRGDRGASALPTGARLEANLAYGADPAQALDAYLPAAGPGGSLVLLVHGGGWAAGDKASEDFIGGKLTHWLTSGLVVVSLNHRLWPVAGPLEQARDVARALALVQRRAASWGVDTSRIAVIAHSSGAHLAALLAVDAALLEAEGARPWAATVLLDGAALDVARLMRAPHLPLHDRVFGADEAGWLESSPMHRLSGTPAPMLLVHSSARPASGEQAEAFAAAVRARGARVELLALPLSHADIGRQLGVDEAYTAQVDAFLRSAGISEPASG